MCGIAGAVPHPCKPEDHVRLGDIVVSDGDGMVQYDRGKQRDPQIVASPTGNSSNEEHSEPFAGFEARFPPRPPCPNLLAAVKRMRAEEMRLAPRDHREWETKIKRFLERSMNQQAWKRPPLSKDKLIDSPDGNGPHIEHPIDIDRRTCSRIRCPRVFLGPIGAANIVQADPKRRDALRDRHGIKAIEMEGSGVADASWIANVGYLVVRGTCDYCNTTKSNEWHQYAALIAASYAHTVIEYLHPVDPIAAATSFDPSAFQQKDHEVDADRLTGARVSEVGADGATSGRLAGSAKSTVVPDEQFETGAKPAVVSTDFDFGQGKATPSTDLVRQMATGVQIRHLDVVESNVVTSLIEQIDTLIEERRWLDIDALAPELERHLHSLPRSGGKERDGWILLARLETHRLFTEKQAEREIDVSRLRALRQEADKCH